MNKIYADLRLQADGVRRPHISAADRTPATAASRMPARRSFDAAAALATTHT